MTAVKRSVSRCVAEIKIINALFRRHPDMDEVEAQRLREKKDGLIDEMAELCPHSEMIAGRSPRKKFGPHGISRRICPRCGYCEMLPNKRRPKDRKGGSGAVFLPWDEYLSREGAILKRLGINI